jgi:hypothetical protein
MGKSSNNKDIDDLNTFGYLMIYCNKRLFITITVV